MAKLTNDGRKKIDLQISGCDECKSLKKNSKSYNSLNENELNCCNQLKCEVNLNILNDYNFQVRIISTLTKPNRIMLSTVWTHI